MHRPVAALQLRRRMNEKFLHAPDDLDLFARDSPRLDDVLSRRVNADPESLERGLAQLVLTIVELLRQIMERQALRRIDTGGDGRGDAAALGPTFMELDRPLAEPAAELGVAQQELDLR